MSEKRHSPFSNGSQFVDWRAGNCERCKKAAPEGQVPTCEIENALDWACLDDGTVSEDIAQRMGYLEHQDRYGWPCGEVEWTEEWKAEVEARLAINP